MADYQEMVSGEDLILACEVSRANAPVQWYCNERRLTGDDHTIIQTSGTLRKIIVSNVQAADSGKYVCDAVDDKMVSIVRIQGSPRSQSRAWVGACVRACVHTHSEMLAF